MSWPTSNVVALNGYAHRKTPINVDPSDMRSQLDFSRHIDRKWIVLPPELFRLVRLLQDRIVQWRENTQRYRYFTARQIAEGELGFPGLGCSTKQVRRLVQELAELGVIFVDYAKASFYGWRIEINFDWEPAEMLPVPKRLQKEKPAVTHISGEENGWESLPMDVHTPSPSVSTPPPHGCPPHIVPSLEDPSLEDPSRTEHAAPRRFGPISTERFSSGERQQETSPAPSSRFLSPTPRTAPAPLPATTADSLLAGYQHRERSRPKILNPVSLQDTFRAAFEQTYAGEPGAIFMPWTVKTMGQIKQALISRWTAPSGEVHEFVRWVVVNWRQIMRSGFDWMRREQPPELPDIRFILGFRMQLMREYRRDLSENWIRAMSDAEEKEFRRLTVKQNLSPEEARMQIAENRAREALRDEIRKGKEAANEAWQKAKLVEERAKRQAAFQPHPESAAAKAAKEQADREFLERKRQEDRDNPLPEDQIVYKFEMPEWK